MTEGNSRTPKLLLRLQVAQSEKRFYEAHQLYKTIYFRCLARKDFSEAIRCLVPGAKFFMENQQWESGTDLACIIVEVLSKSNLKLMATHLTDLCDILKRMPPTCADRTKFLSQTRDLLSKDQILLTRFNEFLGRQFWQEGLLTQARNCMMLAGNGFKMGCFLIEMQQRYGFGSELDLFIAQTVLQFLCMRKASVAALTFYTYTRRHPKLEAGPPFNKFPLLNFVWLLMIAVERKLSLDVLSFLCVKYQTELSRDPSYSDYLRKISQVYFGVKQQENSIPGLISNLVRMLGDGVGDDAEDVDSLVPTSSSMHIDEID